MVTLYWIEESLAGLLPGLWMVGGVGLPWALAALSARQWRSRALAAALALALGPAWLTAWMLILGVLGAQLDLRLLTAEWVLIGSLIISVAGAAIAWRKRRRYASAPRQEHSPLAFDEKLLVAMIAIAVALRLIHTAFWPFTVYDALWVYGSQARLFFLEGMIPTDIGYYPQFVQLQFAYVQLMIGAISDHAARMVIPLMHIGSILAAYLLGERTVSRRVGLITAALWSLHPYVGQWAYRGDLEIPLTFTLTMTAMFFLSAWREDNDYTARRADARLAGIMLGIALFTKPTAGAFVWGILLLLAVELIRSRFDPGRWLARFRLALWTGLACLPMGLVWYARNLLLGHEAITLPKAIWLTRALRNGDYLAPLLVAALIACLALALRHRLRRRELTAVGIGVALVVAGALASNAVLFPARVDPPASYLRAEEALGIALGLLLIAFGLRETVARLISPRAAPPLIAVFWALLLALPYFATFYISYSYHFRLGFAVWPLLCLPSAVGLAAIFRRDKIQRWRAGFRRAYHVALLLVCLPGTVAAATNSNWNTIWLLRDELDDDFKKYEVFNPSLMQVVLGLQGDANSFAREPIVLAPGEERLPFFFPQMRIVDAAATTLDDLEALGATHFVYGAKAREAYLAAGVNPIETQLIASLGRHKLFEKVRAHYHGTFSYELYRVGDLSRRRRLPDKFSADEQGVAGNVFGDRLRVFSRGAFPAQIHKTTPITLQLTWQAMRKLDQDYQFVLHLLEADNGALAQAWRLTTAAHRHGYYATSHWDIGEYVNDRQILYLDSETDRKRGAEYMFALAVWDPQAHRYLPLFVDGAPAGEFLRLPGTHRLRSGTGN
ncbi:MAG: glycosyltransferase family 39 protein [Chloroflexi bacterium]|nr:glycosyltransferase family 39 protein [Chloroflexota bacterium]